MITNVQVEYKQAAEYINELPAKFFKIHNITKLTSTRYNNNLPKTSDLNEFLKRPLRYSFTVFARYNKDDRLPCKNLYLFDNEKDAKFAYRKVMSIWIDEQLEPYRKIVKKGKSLTSYQIEKCKEIQALLSDED